MTSSSKSEIRKSYLQNKYVIITPDRAKRPRDIKEQTIVERTSDCPFCFDKISKKEIIDEIKVNNNAQIIVKQNIFPAVSLDNKKAYGAQEVIIETPDHNKELAELSENEIEQVLRMKLVS